MKKMLAAGAALMMVAACGGGEAGDGQAGNAAAGEAGSGAAAAGASAGDTIRPGLWEASTQMLAMNVPGMPPEAMSGAQEPETSRDCVTEEDTREMAQAFLAQEEGRTCSQQAFTMRGGQIQGRMVCTEDGHETNVSIAGQYSDTTYDITMEMSGRIEGLEQPMSMRLRTQGRRIGECPAGMEDDESSEAMDENSGQ